MSRLKIYQVDAFTSQLFTGNPATVLFLNDWLDDKLMQSIAAEHNHAETAFVVPQTNAFRIRWFTPKMEVDLCGHATLAAAFVLYNFLDYREPEIYFYSPRSGKLIVTKKGDKLYIDFPSDILEEVNALNEIANCIGIRPTETYKGKTDYVAVLRSEDEVRNVKPSFDIIAKLDARGLIVTSEGKKTDFVSRFFAPAIGINEDQVTGSAHTSLIPLWSVMLDKDELTAQQLSQRGGSLYCVNKDDRCLVGGNARLYMIGELYI